MTPSFLAKEAIPGSGAPVFPILFIPWPIAGGLIPWPGLYTACLVEGDGRQGLHLLILLECIVQSG